MHKSMSGKARLGFPKANGDILENPIYQSLKLTFSSLALYFWQCSLELTLDYCSLASPSSNLTTNLRCVVAQKMCTCIIRSRIVPCLSEGWV